MKPEARPSHELTGEEFSSESKPEATSVVSQHSPDGRENNNPSQPKLDNQEKLSRTGQRNGGRTDQGRLHAVRDSVLSRGLLETLTRYGENPRKLRRMEAELRTELKPKGPLGKLLFGRFWSCVLRLILLSRLEEIGLAPRRNAAKRPMEVPSLHEGSMPVLVTTEEQEHLTAVSGTVEALEPDTFRRLALIARYDRAASREMYRTLGLLILMRDGGESGLASGIRSAAGIKAVDGEEK
jgi:hypothetical protein